MHRKRNQGKSKRSKRGKRSNKKLKDLKPSEQPAHPRKLSKNAQELNDQSQAALAENAAQDTKTEINNGHSDECESEGESASPSPEVPETPKETQAAERIAAAADDIQPLEEPTQPQEELHEFPFPPILVRKKKKKGGGDGYESLYELRQGDTESEDSDVSDKTCTNYVECGEEGLCKCRRMQGRNYYDHYIMMKEQEDYTLYPKGRCTLPKGTILHFTGAPDKMRREDVKKAIEELGAKIEFIDYQKGNKEGWVRLSFPYEARIIIKKMTDKKLTIAESELVFRVLSGKEEKRYIKKAVDEILKVRQKGKSLSKMLKKSGLKYV